MRDLLLLGALSPQSLTPRLPSRLAARLHAAEEFLVPLPRPAESPRRASRV